MTRIVVVGAGLAGLTAALRLTQAGHVVTVLEARDRVGGRVHSVTLKNGAVAELGGEWLTQDQKWVTGLANELGIPLSPVGVNFANRDLIGSPQVTVTEHKRVAELVAAAVGTLSDEERSRVSAAELFGRLDDGSDAFTILRNRIEGSAGVPASSIGAFELVGDFGIEETTYLRASGGNQSLAEAISDRLGDLRLEHPVALIHSSDSGVSVMAGEATIEADAVVVAIPLPHAENLVFDPPLDDEVIEALGRLTSGTAAKIVLSTDSLPDLVGLQSGEATWWCWTGSGAEGLPRRAVTGFAGTEAAIEAVASSWPEQIMSALPDVEFGSEQIVVDWGADEWSRGCYSALGPGQEAYLGVFEQIGRVVFAGEYILGAGSIDGAIESGERAAKRLHEYLAD